MDIVNVLTQEHQRLMALLDRADELQAPAANDALLIGLTQELSLHEQAEQGSVWSTLRQQDAVDVHVEELIAQEADLEALLEELVVDLGTEAMHPWLLRVRALVVQHIQAEEQRALPVIQQLLDANQREQLGNDYLAIKAASTAKMARLNVIMAPDVTIAPAKKVT